MACSISTAFKFSFSIVQMLGGSFPEWWAAVTISGEKAFVDTGCPNIGGSYGL